MVEEKESYYKISTPSGSIYLEITPGLGVKSNKAKVTRTVLSKSLEKSVVIAPCYKSEFDDAKKHLR